MTFGEKLVVFWLLASAMASAMAFWRPRSAEGPSGMRMMPLVGAASAGIALALGIVGVESHTLRSHLVQVVPLVFVLIGLRRQSRWSTAAAQVVLTFWLLMMGAIWLFLLGVAQIIGGTFTSIEIALTIAIGLAAALGLSAAIRTPPPATTRLASVATTVLFGGLQAVAMWLSFQPIVTGR